MNRYLSVLDIASTLFPGARGLPFNRDVTPGMTISEEALRTVKDMTPVNAAAGMDLANPFPRSSTVGVQLAQQFPSQVEGDRAQARAQKQMFRDIT